MGLTKQIIIEKIAERIDLKPGHAKNTVEEFLEILKSTLSSGEDIMISGFGKFQVTDKSQRKGRNPATGETMRLDKRRVVTFKCAGKLRERINDRR